ncbi:MAG: GAF domain-containing protein, partial [Gammaproteobacteria bacterium]|nr:GAF domain-containing protein [Gammaproteobacteria bacterium]
AATAIVYSYVTLTPRGVPVNGQQLNDYVAVIHPFSGVPLPTGLQDGDRFDIRKQDIATRIAFMTSAVPLGYVIHAVIDRGTATMVVPVTVVSLKNLDKPGQPGHVGSIQWLNLGTVYLLGVISLLLLWRGRDRAAFGMGLWATTFLLSYLFHNTPLAGWVSFAAICLNVACFLAARVGFYIMIEAGLARALKPKQRTVYRTAFLILLASGAVQAYGAVLVRLLTGSPQYLDWQYGLILTASYFVPIVMLFSGYRPATPHDRVRIRWMLASGLVWVCYISLTNSPVFGGYASALLAQILAVIALLGFLYAVLMLRVVDISVVIDRALVYGGVTALVVGVIAAANSLALHETLTPGASLLLQVLVPLSLGIVLAKVRDYADVIVDRVFFRSKYLAETALRAFAHRAVYIGDVSKLLDTAAEEVRRHTGSPAVAIYSVDESGYRRLRLSGSADFALEIDNDDPAMVAVRAEQGAVDLAGLRSAMGDDGCIFPMLVLGRLRGLVVCANRPGEHYASYEKTLLLEVAHAVGAAWRILIGRSNEAYVRAMAEGRLTTLKRARDRAKALVAA